MTSKLLQKFDNDIAKINQELKRVQSIKCRLKKQRAKAGAKEQLKKILMYEEELKQARQVLRPREKFVTEFTREDVEKLDYDQTVRALKSIQSKKTLTKYLSEVPGENAEYKKACEIERMLQEHKNQIRPIDETTVRKTEVKAILETLETSDNLTKEQIQELLKRLI